MVAPRVTRETPWHTVLIIDDSGSMSGTPAQDVNKGIELMISEMSLLSKGGTAKYFKTSIIKFGSSPVVLEECAEPIDIESNISRVASFSGASGGTDLAAALDEAANVIRRNPGKPSDFNTWVFLFSDGVPNDPGAAKAAANRIKQIANPEGTPNILTFGFGGADDHLLSQIATSTEEYRRISSSSDVVKIFPMIGTAARSAANASELRAQIQSA